MCAAGLTLSGVIVAASAEATGSPSKLERHFAYKPPRRDLLNGSQAALYPSLATLPIERLAFKRGSTESAVQLRPYSNLRHSRITRRASIRSGVERRHLTLDDSAHLVAEGRCPVSRYPGSE
jgi:hypothetical protein